MLERCRLKPKRDFDAPPARLVLRHQLLGLRPASAAPHLSHLLFAHLPNFTSNFTA